MDLVIDLVAYPAAAGACIFVGGLLASVERIRPNWMEQELRHFVIALGGGLLLGAVSLVLVPRGLEYVESPAVVVASFGAGGLAFFGVERTLGLRRREAPQFLATLLDYVPETLALGGIVALEAPGALLLAILIGLQNLPEGFNSFRELVSLSGNRPSHVLLRMTLLIPLGPVLALVGWSVLSSQPGLLGTVMLFASGGIFYLVFQDIAPQARLSNHWFPALGAVLGFSFRLLGQLLIGSV